MEGSGREESGERGVREEAGNNQRTDGGRKGTDTDR